MKRFDLDFIMEFEGGELSDKDMIEAFADGIKKGVVWNLQGLYGRQAQYLIDSGHIDEEGNILKI